MTAPQMSTTQAPARPSSGASPEKNGPLLTVEGLRVWFPVTGGVLRKRVGWVYAVDGVNLSIDRGETLGLVGESGSGKTTVGRAIVRINSPREGDIRLDGENLLKLKGTELRERRKDFQMVFQDPYSSLDPRQTVSSILNEPLETHRDQLPHAKTRDGRRRRVEELLTLVGLDPAFVQRYPHEFSGGQRQRIGIARALAVEPKLIVCDEPISALDVSIQAQVINLLEGLQTQLGLTYLFIAHDLAVVRHIADRVSVMYLGKIVELASSQELYVQPYHPYTAALLSAVPVPDAKLERTRRRIILTGDIPNPANPPTGCRFHTRCWLRERLGNPERCATEEPLLAQVGSGGRAAACHFTNDLLSIIKPGTLLPLESAPPGGYPESIRTGTAGSTGSAGVGARTEGGTGSPLN